MTATDLYQRIVDMPQQLGFLTQARRDFTQQLKRAEDEECDLLHEIELQTTLTRVELRKRAERLRAVLIARREAKDALDVISSTLDWWDKAGVARTFADGVRLASQEYRKLDGRVYTPRVRTKEWEAAKGE